MEEMVELGLTKSIGISNFNKNQIQRIIDNAKIKPSNLQIELHIYLQQHELVNFCKANNIVVTAYSPLGSKGIEEFHKMAGNEYINTYLSMIFNINHFPNYAHFVQESYSKFVGKRRSYKNC